MSTVYCACCGKLTSVPNTAERPYNHCSCGTCVGQPNYCTTDGAFIGTRESHAMHFEAEYRAFVSDAHQE